MVTWVDGDRTRAAEEGVDPAVDVPIPAVAQCSAHGRPVSSTVQRLGAELVVRFATPQRRIAPGQTVALYDPARPDEVMGSGISA
jgi:tRNA U34 2-thiouridine synthase MnmA/TrmU